MTRSGPQLRCGSLCGSLWRPAAPAVVGCGVGTLPFAHPSAASKTETGGNVSAQL